MAKSIVRCLARVIAINVGYVKYASWPDHWPPYAINTYDLTAYHDRYVGGSFVETIEYAHTTITDRTSSYTAPGICPWPLKATFLKAHMQDLWAIYRADNPNDKFDRISFYSNGGCGIDVAEGRGWQYDPAVEAIPPDGVDPYNDPYGPSLDPNNPPPDLPDGKDACPAGFEPVLYLQKDPDDLNPIILSNNCYAWGIDLLNPCNGDAPPSCSIPISLQPTAVEVRAAARLALACEGLPELDGCLVAEPPSPSGGNRRPNRKLNAYRGRGTRSAGRYGGYYG